MKKRERLFKIINKYKRQITRFEVGGLLPYNNYKDELDMLISDAEEKRLQKIRYLENQNFLEMQIKEKRLRKKYAAKFEKEFEKRLGFENKLKVLESTYNSHSSGRDCLVFCSFLGDYWRLLHYMGMFVIIFDYWRLYHDYIPYFFSIVSPLFPIIPVSSHNCNNS